MYVHHNLKMEPIFLFCLKKILSNVCNVISVICKAYIEYFLQNNLIFFYFKYFL